MAASSLNLDLTGKSAANKFTAEAQLVDSSVDRSVWPVNHPFFFNDGTFKVEGRINTGPWMELSESLHFVYSPMFVEYSISTGKEIASYIVMLDATITEVRFTYQALGREVDATVVEEIMALENANLLDRSSVTNWGKVKGLSPNYAPTEDPNVIGKSSVEKTYLMLSHIRDAILNPNSVTAILPSDLTSLELKLAEKVSAEDVEGILTGITSGPIEVAANAWNEIYRMENLYNGMRGIIHMQVKGTQQVNVIPFTAYRPDSGVPWVVLEDPGGLAALNTMIRVEQAGTDWSLQVQTSLVTNFSFKLLARFKGA